MRFLNFATSSLLLGITVAVPTPLSGHVLHEKRTQSSGLVRRHRAPPTTTVPVRIGFSQSNLDTAHELLMELSDPFSPKYGQHMSSTEVGNLFRPSSDSIGSVRDWLHASGIDTERHELSPGRGWLKFEATVEELESLLATEYHVYEHAETEALHLGCDEYHVPHSVHPHIDFITPTVSTIQVKRGVSKNKRGARALKTSPARFPPITKPAGGIVNAAALATGSGSGVQCYVAMTPGCIRTLYDIPVGTHYHKGNEIGIFEDGDWYDQQDLDLTFAAFSPNIKAGTHPALEGIDGAIAPFSIDGYPQIGEESLLDMSIIIPLVHPQTSILFQVDDLTALESSYGFGDTFLDALDASYCTFEGGDDPNLDPHYPDNWQAPGALNGTGWVYPFSEMCGAYKPTNVISISYGLGEEYFSFFYENRQCVEYLKLGLQGTTVVYASGDSGVSDRYNCLIPANATYNGDPGAFAPSFPASCPYVTAVGATQLNPDGKTETAVAVPELEYYSGGGFSNNWPIPDYQQSTIADYFKNNPSPYNLTSYGTPYFNSSGRGYPDVSANGLNMLLYANALPTFVSGTSMSAPIFASIINLINEERLSARKSTVGFINPVLYKNPHAFTDITTGSNPGCNTNGFNATKGWDPVTGLGTPKFEKLLDVFMALP